MKAWLVLLTGLAVAGFSAEDDGKILRPADHSSHANGPVDIVATAPAGKLQLDGKPLSPEHPFPNVFHLSVQPAAGLHRLTLSWDGGKKEVEFFAGPNPPAGFAPFHQHPPVAGVQCTQCHELTKRGRFHFKDGCFDCHQQEAFVKVHTHKPDVLSECGLCHNAHGSTVKAHLILTKELACKQCHN